MSNRVNPTEFVSAFSRYKEVILERFPERARELDAYMMTIVELGTNIWAGHTGNTTYYLQNRQLACGPEAFMQTGLS